MLSKVRTSLRNTLIYIRKISRMCVDNARIRRRKKIHALNEFDRKNVFHKIAKLSWIEKITRFRSFITDATQGDGKSKIFL